jgi:hypothetical protein
MCRGWGFANERFWNAKVDLREKGADRLKKEHFDQKLPAQEALQAALERIFDKKCAFVWKMWGAFTPSIRLVDTET